MLDDKNNPKRVTPRTVTVPPEITTYLNLVYAWTSLAMDDDSPVLIEAAAEAVLEARSDATACFHTQFMPGSDVVEKAIEFAALLLKLFGNELSTERAREELLLGATARLNFDLPKYFSAADQLVGQSKCDALLRSLVKRANDGDPFADEAARFQATVCIARGQPLPEPLLSYVIALLDHRPPKMNRGQNPAIHTFRDFYIVTTVEEVILLGFRATRNREQSVKRASACTVVHKALERLGRPMSERAVEASWGKFVRPGQAVEAAGGE